MCYVLVHNCMQWNIEYHCIEPITVVLGPVEADPEYQLIVESNNMLVELDTEISMSTLSMRVLCTIVHT